MSKILDGIKSIDQFPIEDKRVFLRVDFNVPMQDGQITDDTRIQAALPTIKYALEQKAKLVIATHFGRPKGKVNPEFSLEPLGAYLNELLDVDVILVEEPRGEAPKALLAGLKDNQVLMLENLRFDAGEEANEREYAQAIAEYIDIYINDAFGASHRAHMSIVGLPQVLEKKGIGFLMKKEVEMLDRVRNGYESPYVAILGGSKVSDKIDVLEMLIEKVDALIIGGAMAYTFLAARGVPLGASRVEAEKVKFAKDLLRRMDVRGKKILLPVDHVISTSLDATENAKEQKEVSIPADWMGLDIGPKTRELYAEEIRKAKTVFWNGPMGVFEKPAFAEGTFAVAKAVSECEGITIVGGGDSAAAAKESGYADKISHISTGGGASLEFIQGLKLPGLEAVRPAKRSEKVDVE